MHRELTVAFHYIKGVAEIFVYKTDHSAVFDSTAEYFYEFTMIHPVEETFEVKVEYIDATVIDYTLCSSQCLMATSSRTEAVADFRELILIDWTQHLVYGLLNKSVYYGGISCHCLSILYPLHLHRPFRMTMGFDLSCNLIHNQMPYMKFLSVRSDVCRRLLSDFTSR